MLKKKRLLRISVGLAKQRAEYLCKDLFGVMRGGNQIEKQRERSPKRQYWKRSINLVFLGNAFPIAQYFSFSFSHEYWARSQILQELSGMCSQISRGDTDPYMGIPTCLRTLTPS